MDLHGKNQKYIEIGNRIMEFMRLSVSGSTPVDITDKIWAELAFELFKLQAEYVEPYKNLCRYHLKTTGLYSISENYLQIPTIPTSSFKEYEVTSLIPEERTRVFYSSGTTYEKTSRHYHCDFSLKIYEDSLSFWFLHCVVLNNFSCGGLLGKQFDVPFSSTAQHQKSLPVNFIFLTPPPGSVPHSSLVHMFSTLKEKFGNESSDFYGVAETETAWKIDFKKLENALCSLDSNSIPFICGTAFNYVHLLEYCDSKSIKFKLPDNTIVFETGGYKGRSREIPKNELYSRISEAFSVSSDRIVSEYGMSELSSQAYDNIINEGKNNPRKFRFPPWAKFSIISPDTREPVGINEIGLLRIYDLANVYSVFAIQTDDLAVNLGDGFLLAGRAGASEPRGCSIMVNI